MWVYEKMAKLIEGGHPWMGGGASTSSVADSYQYQLQSMWQKCWNTNQQNLVQQLRFRERGPLKSWRPEAMAEAIFSVLKEGLSLSQAARKYDIPYPTFVLYANRVHNMLGPSLDGGTDPRPKARGRPQRILLGMWPEELIRSVIKAVVFRDYREIKDEMSHPYANGQGHVSPYGTPVNPGANGYHNAAKFAAQNAALAPPDSASPLSTMTETLRRQIMSQQQQSPISQTMNMYKSPAYLQRSEIEDQVTAVAAAAKHQAERRGSENMPDLSALGLMGIPGLNVMPTQGQRSSQMHSSSFGRERERERERDRERERERDRERERERERDIDRERERDRELKEAMQARQYGNQSRSSSAGSTQKQSLGPNNNTISGGGSNFQHMRNKEHPSYAYNKRLLESLPPGIDFESIANNLLQKSVNKSPRFEDFFPGQDMSELFSNPEMAAGGSYSSMRDTQLMKIKLEQAAEVPHED
ncbi:protein bric-a-brac 2-like [Teleopsis dalmanni]|uniref:protein bric-a-brac 2-like n=1 Tax=Teleopsis dalmanni TaxID=139649 RepID=UPI0018CEA7EB|nr:protein bric-a-brac 2-like [Teleopsis dalmanni]